MPLSGRAQSGSVTASENVNSAGGVATVEGSIQVGGDFTGSVLTSKVPAGTISLTLAEAIQKGLAANLGGLTAGTSARAARASKLQALSALLPDISAQASEAVTQVNLAAYGFQFKLPANIPLSIPSVVGPFSYSTLEGTLSQSVWDPVAHRNYSAAKESERASVASAKDARELIVLAVAGTYLQTVADASRIESQRAQVQSAQAVYNQTVTRKQAGTNARIDVTRSAVELQTQRQRLNVLEGDFAKRQLTLARIIGLPQDRLLVLSETLSPALDNVADPTQAIAQALSLRNDVRAAETQVHAAELALSAAHAERLPSLSVSGDYGAQGPNPANAHGIFAVTGTLNVPIYQGGRVRGDIKQAEAVLEQRRAELVDQRARVEQDVRDAVIELRTASGQIKLAASNRDYAHETLEQAKDRFAAGVSTTVEVVQAQEQVASAESDYISSLFALDLARVSLARATGQAEARIPNLLKEDHR